MSIDIDFLSVAKWIGIGTLVFGAIAFLAFWLQWGIRFRLVGVTGFMAVLTAGLYALVLGLSVHTTVPGSVRYSLVYDDSATRTAIAVPPSITESELEATLQEAAENIFSYGRLGRGTGEFVVRARTVVHPEPGLSQILYLGSAKRLSDASGDEEIQIEIDRESLGQLFAAAKAVESDMSQ